MDLKIFSLPLCILPLIIWPSVTPSLRWRTGIIYRDIKREKERRKNMQSYIWQRKRRMALFSLSLPTPSIFCRVIAFTPAGDLDRFNRGVSSFGHLNQIGQIKRGFRGEGFTSIRMCVGGVCVCVGCVCVCERVGEVWVEVYSCTL